MFVLVYAPHGTVGEDGSKVTAHYTLRNAQREMRYQVDDFIWKNHLDPYDRTIEDRHATAGLADYYAPEWHIYEI